MSGSDNEAAKQLNKDLAYLQNVQSALKSASASPPSPTQSGRLPPIQQSHAVIETMVNIATGCVLGCVLGLAQSRKVFPHFVKQAKLVGFESIAQGKGYSFGRAFLSQPQFFLYGMRMQALRFIGLSSLFTIGDLGSRHMRGGVSDSYNKAVGGALTGLAIGGMSGGGVRSAIMGTVIGGSLAGGVDAAMELANIRLIQYPKDIPKSYKEIFVIPDVVAAGGQKKPTAAAAASSSSSAPS